MKIQEFMNMRGYRFSKLYITEMWENHDTHRFYIYDDGLNIPVFHIIPDDNYIDICICLCEPRYYQYNRERYLYNMPVDELDNFLRQPCKLYDGKYTNWQALVMTWKAEQIGSKIKYKIPKKQPDYTKLEDNPIKRRSIARWLKAKIYA